MVKKIDFIVVFLVAILGIIVGSFLDLQINEILYFPNNAFGLTLSSIGEAPVYALFSALGIISILLGWNNYKKWYQRIILFILGAAGILLPIYFQGDHFICVDGFNIPSSWYIGLIVGLVVSGLGVLLGIYLHKVSDSDKLVRYLITLFVIIVISILVVQVTKTIMDRPRYRFLVSKEGSLNYFCQWWERGSDIKEFLSSSQIPSDEFKSFPSGHTNIAALALPLLAYLPLISSKIKINSRVLFYIAFGYTLVVAVSRITVAAHFLSDVSFALFITTFVYWIGEMLLVRNDNLWNATGEKIFSRNKKLVKD